MADKLEAGWAFPARARKAHYFPAGDLISLCGRWMFAGPRNDDGLDSPDDCAACRRCLNDKRAQEQGFASARHQTDVTLRARP